MLTSPTPRLSVAALVGAAMAAATLAPSASAAAQRYATPAGFGTTCSSADPCGVIEAVQAAGAGDEVIIKPGDYPLPGGFTDTAPITIHGVAGKPRPRLFFSGKGVLLLDDGSTLRHIELVRPTGNGVISAKNATLDQVIARSGGYTATADVQNSTIRNSIFEASGDGGRALLAEAIGVGNNTALRNVTAIATGAGAVAVEASASSGAGGNALIGATNVIARGGPGGASFQARTDSSGAQATIGLGHSNYGAGTLSTVGTNATTTSGGGNQSAPVVFVDAAAGDYRQAPGSPTIDAGLDDLKNGALDVDGDPRTIGTTDIGADEFVSAPATPGTPATSGTGGSGGTGGTDGTGGGANPAPASAPSTNAPLNMPASSRPFAGVTLVSTRLIMAGRFITLKLSCPTGTVGRCSGRTTLSTRARRSRSGATRQVRLGGAAFSIEAGKQVRVSVRVSRAGRQLLEGTRRLRGRATNTARDGAGKSKTAVAAVTIRSRRR